MEQPPVVEDGETPSVTVLHTGCGSFEVNRSAFDLGDPFSAPTLSLPGAALCAHARAIECRSRAVAAAHPQGAP